MIRKESAIDLVRMLNAIYESPDIEAKEISNSELGKSVFETISSLSNEPDLGGGTILLGITEESNALFPFFSVSGIENIGKLQNDLVTACATKFNVPVRVTIAVENVDGKNVLRIDVPEISQHQKPVYFKTTGLPQGAYRRFGSADVKCTDEDMLILLHGKSQEAHDIQIVDGVTMDDIDSSAIERYRRIRERANASAEELNYSDSDM